MRNTKNNLVQQALARLRVERIRALGAFGAKRERIKPDRTQYTRKSKHTKKSPVEGSFDFWSYQVPVFHVEYALKLPQRRRNRCVAQYCNA